MRAEDLPLANVFTAQTNLLQTDGGGHGTVSFAVIN